MDRPILALPCLLALAAPASAATLLVPGQFSTIQAAINAAADGDVIEVSRGVYPQALTVTAKTLTIRSVFPTSGDPADIEETILEASGDVVTMNGAANVTLQGLHLREGQAAVRINAGGQLVFEDGRVRDTSDGISLEGGSSAATPITRATIRRSILEGSSDDAVDSDGKSELWIEDSTLRNNGDEGVEIRLHNNDFAPGQSITHVILRSRLTANGEDGLQLIDYDELTPRSFRIERNVFARNEMAGIGVMCNGNTVENFEGCPMPEAVRLVNNTFVENDHGLTGGVDLIGVNNLFAANTTLGAKNVAGASLLAFSLFHGNGTSWTGSQVDEATTSFGDPLLAQGELLADGSAAIDAGTAAFVNGAEVVVDLPPTAYGGAAPDLGALEWIPGTEVGPELFEARVDLGSDDAEEGPGSTSLTGTDLELVADGATTQTVGLRFRNVAVPQGAPILSAAVQFQADETSAIATSLQIEGQADDDPPTFTSAAGSVSTRPRTAAAVAWTPPPWTVVGGAGAAERTPDLAAIVQEIVDRPGWAPGNALALVVTGTGTRTAETFEGDPDAAPLLQIEFVVPGCGNGYLESGEACDDGNLVLGDGCDARCQVSIACSDGVDNDSDAHLDFGIDPGCSAPEDDSEREAGLPCDDGLDDDGDVGIDWAGDDDHDGISDPPGDIGCANPLSPSESPECQDGADNDADLRIDFDGGASLAGGVPFAEPDPHCAGPWDGIERVIPPPACGFGPELLAALLGLAALRRRSAR
jgi:cysteine-rich repeat protein